MDPDQPEKPAKTRCSYDKCSPDANCIEDDVGYRCVVSHDKNLIKFIFSHFAMT